MDDGNLNVNYLKDYIYEPKLVIIDNLSKGELENRPEMQDIINSQYVDFVEGFFQGKSSKLLESYGQFDFVWFDCGGTKDYEDFLNEYWCLCSGYIFFHFTYSDGIPNQNYKAIMSKSIIEPFKIDIVEPHKSRQGSLTIIKKKLP